MEKGLLNIKTLQMISSSSSSSSSSLLIQIVYGAGVYENLNVLVIRYIRHNFNSGQFDQSE
jgi:hypothetical protein